MHFDLNKSIEILERTPKVVSSLLSNLSDDWISQNEGLNTWSPYDIVGHLIHGERTDWIVRIQIILQDNHPKTFNVFDRFAQFEQSKGKSIQTLLKEFSSLRAQNLEILQSLNIQPENLNLEGIHPEFGTVTLKQLLSTWVVHDLGHLAQISRVMAAQYQNEVGPWKAYLGILN